MVSFLHFRKRNDKAPKPVFGGHDDARETNSNRDHKVYRLIA